MPLRLEPEWWARCRALKGQGFTYPDIAKRLGVSRSAVSYCLSSRIRASAIAKSSRAWADRKARGESDAGRGDDLERQKLRRIAREEFVAQGGGNPKDLRKIYRQYDCH